MSQKGTATELGTERIGKLLMQYAIPAIIAMTASSLYNMVDSIFIGHGVGPLAISGLAITFPLMNLAAAFGSLVGVGASTLISVKLGQKDYTTAQQILGNVVSLNLIIGVLFTIVCLLFLDPILYFFGASEATLPYAKDYYGDHLIRKCNHPHVFRTQLGVALSRTSSKGHGRHHTDCYYQHFAGSLVHLHLPHGNKGSRRGNCPGSGDFTLLAYLDFLQQK